MKSNFPFFAGTTKSSFFVFTREKLLFYSLCSFIWTIVKAKTDVNHSCFCEGEKARKKRKNLRKGHMLWKVKLQFMFHFRVRYSSQVIRFFIASRPKYINKGRRVVIYGQLLISLSSKRGRLTNFSRCLPGSKRAKFSFYFSILPFLA